jgi:hypothetical protein
MEKKGLQALRRPENGFATEGHFSEKYGKSGDSKIQALG